MLLMNAPRDRRVGAYDIIMTAAIAGDIANKVFAGRQVQGCSMTYDQPQS